MEIKPKVLAQQRQAITINSQVIQSIRMLQFSSEELREFLRDTAERNPLIEIATQGDEPSEDTRAVRDSTAHGTRQPEWFTPSRRGDMGDVPNLEEYCAAPVSLRDHLLAQVALAARDPFRQRIAAEIVESLDDDGYFRRDPGDLADLLGVPLPHVDEALHMVQRLEPIGVGARNLPECLRLQLAERGRDTPEMLVLLENLRLLATSDIDQLARLCRTGRTEIVAMQRELRTLDPRPGRQFGSSTIQPALPDVLVECAPDGTVTVELNTAVMPRVLVNRQYSATIRKTALGAQEEKFVADCLRDANWLVHSLDQRARTILRIATEIVKRQSAYFHPGPARLMPLALKDIAVALGIHESTVCRATANKFMMTHRGMAAMKHFFVNAIAASNGGEEVSADLVRQKIRDLISAETELTVLPDDVICANLRRDGIEIARRTVAKYRAMLNIPTATTRRRQRAAAGLDFERTGLRPDVLLAGAER